MRTRVLVYVSVCNVIVKYAAAAAAADAVAAVQDRCAASEFECLLQCRVVCMCERVRTSISECSRCVALFALAARVRAP